MARTSLLALAVLASSTLVSAAPRRPSVKVEVELSERVKPKVRPPAAAPAPISADKILEIEVLTSPIRADQEGILLQLVEDTPDSEADEKSDLLFRLGELYAKQHRLYRLQAIELEMQNKRAKATVAADTARKYLAKAAGAYKRLTDNQAFQHYKQMDLALFVYGYMLQNGGYHKEARGAFDKLLKNYPASKWVTEAHLAFAEYYWEAGQLDDAEDRYKLVLKSPRTNAYWYASYKLGWIQLNRKQYQDALETFYQVANATAKDPKREVLHRNAKKDFVRAYAEIGKVDKAHVAFKRVDASGAFDMYETLAGFYMEQGKSDKAIYAYRDLMKLVPKHANVCQWQYEVAHAMLTLPGATLTEKTKEIDDLARMYTVLSRTKVLPASQASECRENAAAMSGELARAYHSEYSKTFSADSSAAASKLYATYLKAFASEPDAPKTRYYLAELTWVRAERERDPRLKTELWEETARVFIEVVKEGKVDDATITESAYAAASAYLEAHRNDPRTPTTNIASTTPSSDEVPKPVNLPEREQHMIEAFDLYLTRTKNPPETDLVQMKFLKANVLRRFNHFDKSIPIFKDILAKHPNTPHARDAGLLLVDIYILTKNEPALLALTDQLLANKDFLADNEDVRDKLERIKIIALRNGVQKIEQRAKKTGDLQAYVDCGVAYLDIYNRNPEDEQNDEILYNAGVCFEQGRSLETAIKMFDMLARYYPKSPLAARALPRAGKAYADMAFYGLAAAKYEQFAKKYAGEKDAYDAMNDAVFFYKGIGSDDKAIDGTRYFVKAFGGQKPAEAAAAAFSLTSIYEKQHDTAALIKHLREYIRVHGAKGGAANLVIAHAKLGQALFGESCSIPGVDGACIRVTRERAVSSRAATKVRTALKTRCGDDSKIKITVVNRDGRLTREARDAFAAATRELAKVPATSPDYGLARHYVGQAKLAEATLELETYYDLAFPQNLDFDKRQAAVAKKSLARFDAWLVNKEAAGRRTAERFAAVLDLKDNASSIAAAARLGQISQHFADALFTADIPKDVRSGAYAEDKIEAYCEVLEQKADPLAVRAVEAFDTCLKKSTELGWFSEWSQLCERELGQIQPDKFPTASERRSEADRMSTAILIRTVEAPPALD